MSKKLKKLLIFTAVTAGLLLVFFIVNKKIPTQREIDEQQRELQTLKDQLFDCEAQVNHTTCTVEDVDTIQKKIQELQKNK